MNGSMLVPMRGLPKDIVITFVISFSIGTSHRIMSPP